MSNTQVMQMIAQIAAEKMVSEYLAGRPLQENMDDFAASLRDEIAEQGVVTPHMNVQLGFALLYTAMNVKSLMCVLHGAEFEANVNWVFPDGTEMTFMAGEETRPADGVLDKWAPAHIVFNDDATDFKIFVKDIDDIKAGI